MILAALLDAGCAPAPIEEALGRCGVGVALELSEVRRAGLRGLRVEVRETEPSTPRTIAACIDAVEAGALEAEVAASAVSVLRALGRAEARLHGVSEDEVRLHELGAVDTLVDIVGVCAALHALQVTDLRCSPLPAAPGSVTGEHGTLPLPAPATLELLAAVGAPLIPGRPGVEQVTPTAAALITVLGRFAPPALRLRRVGHGAGSRDDPDHPNLVRCWLGEALPAGEAAAGGPVQVDAVDQACIELRTNLDDVSPAVVAALAARCLEVGALDAWVVSATMKKGRPGHVLHALVPAGAERALAALLLAESPTLGVRLTPAARLVAGRDSTSFASPLGSVTVKRKWVEGRVVDARPELEDCRRLAAASGRPLHAVVEAVSAAARAAFVSPP